MIEMIDRIAGRDGVHDRPQRSQGQLSATGPFAKSLELTSPKFFENRSTAWSARQRRDRKHPPTGLSSASL